MPPDEPFTASTSEVRQLIHRLIGLQNKWPSEPTLANLSPRMVNGLLVYNDIVTRGLPWMRLIYSLICGFFFVLWATTPGLPLLLAAAVPLMITWMYRYNVSKDYAGAVYALTQSEDLRVMPVLIKATDNEWGRHVAVLSAIRRLLEQITEEHLGLLSPDVQEKLWYLAVPPVTLEAGGDEDLARSAVQALARIGNHEMLVRMQRMVRVSAVYPVHRRLQELMEQLIPVMEARLQQQQLPQTLLRASDASSAPPNTLLRAVYTSTPEVQQQLLRASASDNTETEG